MRLFRKKQEKEDMRFIFINGFPFMMESRRLVKQMKIEILLDPENVTVATYGKITRLRGKEQSERKIDYVV